MRKAFLGAAGAVAIVALLFTMSRPAAPDTATILAQAARYDARILRDTWGVPHVFGTTDADVAYGLAYAHCEDDFETIQGALIAARGQLARHLGRGAAANDYMVHLLRIWDDIDAKYETDLRPETRALCEAYAAGFNHYAVLHPDKVKPGVLPATGKDIIAGFVHKVPLFFGVDGALQELFKPERQRRISMKSAETAFLLTEGPRLPTGSNTFSVAPSRSADGKTRLAINSHQPYTGPVAWYEVHLHSADGWDMAGGVFPGSPLIHHGHNRHLGWAHTVNSPDLVDVYVLDINPANRYQYKLDGKWYDLERRTARIRVRLWKFISWTFRRELLWSPHHGPVVRRPHGTYALRFANMGDLRAVEQWYRMNKAANFDEWLVAMRTGGLPAFNTGYADERGNIFYVYNGRLPVRAEGYDWEQYLPGDTSETVWTEYLPFDALPQVKNPKAGFVINCNSNPFRATAPGGNADPDAYSPTLGIETHMTNRALRAMELFGSDESITAEEFYTYKFDMRYSVESEAAQVREEVLAAPPSDDPVVQRAVEVLRAWDLGTEPHNRNTAIGVLTAQPVVTARFSNEPPPNAYETFVKSAHVLQKYFGRVDPPWREVNRLRRGDVDLGLGGGPDILHAVYGKGPNDGRLTAQAGDCFVLLVEWGPDGVSSQSIHQFGSATLDEASPHYADQAPLFVQRKLKPVWMDEAEIRAHLEREYRPGEER